MKKLSLLVATGVLTSLPVFAAKSSGIIGKNLDLKTLNANKTLTLETGVSTERDDENEIAGYGQFFKVETGLKLNSNNNISIGTQYDVRQYDDEENERKNRDHLTDAYLKLTNKSIKFRDNGIADIRLQARVYSDQDPFFKEFYGSDGNYQTRMYFGRPLAGKFSISKYTSYLRYKKYMANENFSDRSRDHEFRARISPTYAIMDGLDLGTTFTYNQIYTQNSDYDSEAVDVDLSLRYQQGKYAILGIASYPYMQTNEDGDLAYNKDSEEDIEYSLILSAYIF